MITTVYYMTRKDDVKLFLTLDAQTDDNGQIVIGTEGLPEPRGYYILQNETDIEGAYYTYSETNKPILIIDTASNEPKEEY